MKTTLFAAVSAVELREVGHVLSSTETTATIIVKPKTPQGWVAVTPLLHSEIYFHVRQRALQFGRAYAKLHRPGRVCVLNEAGDVEAEEIFAHILREASTG